MTEFYQNLKAIHSVIIIIMQNICKVMQTLYTTTRAKLRTYSCICQAEVQSVVETKGLNVVINVY